MFISQQINAVTKNITEALFRRSQSGYETSQVKLVAVTKNHGIEAMREAIDSGISSIGENRIQEAVKKKSLLNRDVEWHLIGHLQTNKVRQAVTAFDVIHSVDSEKLAVEISRVAGTYGKVQDVLLQVNIGAESTKFGIAPGHLYKFAAFCGNLEFIRICGIMAIAPYFEDAEKVRPLFRELYHLFCESRQQRLPNGAVEWLSMGMTNDYTIAIEEGSNLIRIGTGIFGSR